MLTQGDEVRMRIKTYSLRDVVLIFVRKVISYGPYFWKGSLSHRIFRRAFLGVRWYCEEFWKLSLPYVERYKMIEQNDESE